MIQRKLDEQKMIHLVMMLEFGENVLKKKYPDYPWGEGWYDYRKPFDRGYKGGIRCSLRYERLEGGDCLFEISYDIDGRFYLEVTNDDETYMRKMIYSPYACDPLMAGKRDHIYNSHGHFIGVYSDQQVADAFKMPIGLFKAAERR